MKADPKIVELQTRISISSVAWKDVINTINDVIRIYEAKIALLNKTIEQLENPKKKSKKAKKND